MKHGCAVNGLIVRPGMGGSAMCSKIIVGGQWCGSDTPCHHQTIPASVAAKTDPAVAQVLQDIQDGKISPS